MIERFSWVGDDAGYEAPDVPFVRGDAQIYRPDDFYPDVQRPIGFMRTKPRVRIKAWMQPIVKVD